MSKNHPLVVLLSFWLASHAAVVGAAPLTGTLKENEKLILVLNDSIVTVIPSTGRQFQITNADTGEVLSLQSKENAVEVRAPERAEKPGKKTPMKVDVVMPASPLELHVFDGAISVSKHKGDMVLHLQKGRLTVKETQGQATVHAQKGEIQVLSHTGKLIVDSYLAAVTVKELQGDMELQNFGGETYLEKNKGFLSVNSGQGAVKISQSQGSLSFELGKGTLNANQFQGRIDGQSQEGAITIAMVPESDVNVKSTSGRVTVQTPPNIGAYINVVSQEGDIYAPSYMKVNRDGGVRVLRGRLKGDTQKGTVVVRTQDGAVVIK